MMNSGCLEQSNIIYSANVVIDGMQEIFSVADSNEHSIQNIDPYSIRHSPHIGCSVVAEEESKVECSNFVGLPDNQVLVTRLEDNLNSVIRLHDNLSSLSLECNNEIDVGRCYNFALSYKMEESKMKIDIDPEGFTWLRKMGKLNETPNDVIIRVLSQAYACELCCNLE